MKVSRNEGIKAATTQIVVDRKMTALKANIRSRFELEKMLQTNSTVVVADPSLSSSNCGLPMIEFINEGVVPKRNKVDVKKDPFEKKNMNARELNILCTKASYPSAYYKNQQEKSAAVIPSSIK